MTEKIDFIQLQSQYENPHSQNYKKIQLVNSFIYPDESLLDIGSGTGSFIELVHDKFQEIYAIEQDPLALGLLQKKFSSNPKIHIIPQQIVDFFGDKNNKSRFSTITCLDVLEHLSLEECQQTIHSLFKILEPGGLIIISVPGIFEKIRIILGRSPTHLHSHSSYQWAGFLKDAGYEIVSIQTVEFPFTDHIFLKKHLHLFGKCCVIVAVKPEAIEP